MAEGSGGRKAPSLAGRFAAAVGLTIGFYALAILLAAALIGLPVYGWAEHGRGNIFVTIFGVVTGLSILAAIVPRRLPFAAPGPRIDREDQPRLMAAVEEVARETGQEMPSETYATLQVNAAVTEVSNGFLRGRRRVLIVGLPLLHVLSEREFRGVLAHEFGHYAGGDTRLGPWIWRTRETIGRTIERLTDDEDDSWSQRAVRAPFIWYGKAFLRITNAISRREEFAADALAARTVGRDAHVAALRRIHALAPGFDLYWGDEVLPVLNAGFRPPVLAGFSGFVRSAPIERAAAEHLERELAEERADPYSSHPTLAERIAAVEHLPAGPPDDSAPAAALLDGEEALERRALDQLGPTDELQPVAWDDVGDRVWVTGYGELVRRNADLLGDTTADDIGALAADPSPIVHELHRTEEEMVPEDQAVAFARHLLGAALTTLLARHGWRAEAPLGEPIRVVSGEQRVEPHALVAELADGTATDWPERVAALGIAGERLALPAEAAGERLAPPPEAADEEVTPARTAAR